MRISDWSSDVCSSDLLRQVLPVVRLDGGRRRGAPGLVVRLAVEARRGIRFGELQRLQGALVEDEDAGGKGAGGAEGDARTGHVGDARGEHLQQASPASHRPLERKSAA